MKRVNECAIKIAKFANANSGHLDELEQYELTMELIARLMKAKIEQERKLFKKPVKKQEHFIK